jgi:hypothetical protein
MVCPCRAGDAARILVLFPVAVKAYQPSRPGPAVPPLNAAGLKKERLELTGVCQLCMEPADTREDIL